MTLGWVWAWYLRPLTKAALHLLEVCTTRTTCLSHSTPARSHRGCDHGAQRGAGHRGAQSVRGEGKTCVCVCICVNEFGAPRRSRLGLSPNHHIQELPAT